MINSTSLNEVHYYLSDGKHFMLLALQFLNIYVSESLVHFEREIDLIGKLT
jgi:hypothetical protein